jgi:quinol-cytochrome oxidoreductase complex cytochrome b subunit
MAHEEHEGPSIPFFPNHFMTEFYVTVGVLVLMVIVGVIGMIHPLGLGEPADPMNTPLHVKAHWYFVFLQEMLKYIPKNFGVTIPIIGVAVLLFWPFFDPRENSARARRFRIGLVSVVLAIVIVLTIIGLRS